MTNHRTPLKILLSSLLLFLLFITQGCMEIEQKSLRENELSTRSPTNLSSKQEIEWEGNIARFQVEGEEPSETGGIVYLTFDDGPSEHTKDVLEILKVHNAKATFFVNGHETELAKDMYRKIAEDGHVLANHTYSHQYDEIYSSAETFMEDVRALEVLIEEVTGEKTRFFRFPGGSNSSKALRHGGEEVLRETRDLLTENNYLFFDWDVDSMDSARPNQDAQVIITETLKQVKGKEKAVVLFHDGPKKQSTVEALPVILDQLKEWGYSFKPLTHQSPTRQFKF
ncbi:polysaccharide deacetylase family protein [Evansella tamaricis]|uniref:Polysaccharide deacetylase n=1 Tax=Evansella tamaricis TaxID=2069301 RepID=A0ABS6JMS4_9BACI|nr:polysaccharide deacetylase family protein [Evansella tamaricis]MBU9714881.1 polysaccharide deacetylase [Evansella tamaricis]